MWDLISGKNFIYFVGNIFLVIFMEEYIITVDDKGRMLIPSKVRKLLNINKDTRLKMKIIKGRIVLEHAIPKVRKVRIRRAWGSEAFLDAGEAAFGEY